MQLAREQLTRLRIVRLDESWLLCAIRAKEPSSWHVTQAARDHSLSVEENSKQHIVALRLLTRVFEPRSSRLYDVGGLSVPGDIDADAIVKSSTNLQNSVSLNSRMLAYAATMRSARTRAWRSPLRRVILISAMMHRLPYGQPCVPRE
jgi:hypothetical protein